MTTLKSCTECINHFGIDTSGIIDGHPVWQTTDPTKCDYHTDYTGRAAQKDRLLAEWSANHPEGWASV